MTEKQTYKVVRKEKNVYHMFMLLNFIFILSAILVCHNILYIS